MKNKTYRHGSYGKLVLYVRHDCSFVSLNSRLPKASAVLKVKLELGRSSGNPLTIKGRVYLKEQRHWYEEDNTAFLVERVAFPIHGSVFSRRSTVMPDLISVPHPFLLIPLLIPIIKISSRTEYHVSCPMIRPRISPACSTLSTQIPSLPCKRNTWTRMT